jgi:hypothetical protein
MGVHLPWEDPETIDREEIRAWLRKMSDRDLERTGPRRGLHGLAGNHARQSAEKSVFGAARGKL